MSDINKITINMNQVAVDSDGDEIVDYSYDYSSSYTTYDEFGNKIVVYEVYESGSGTGEGINYRTFTFASGNDLIYRFYNPSSKGHFFTASETERDTVLDNPQWGYQFEGIGFHASESPEDGLLPVFRFYNSQSKGHFFTISTEERDAILANPDWGYQFENVGFYAYGADANLGTDIYRFYNPFSRGHFFTSSAGERDAILANPQWGYQFEGVAFEGVVPS